MFTHIYVYIYVYSPTHYLTPKPPQLELLKQIQALKDKKAAAVAASGAPQATHVIAAASNPTSTAKKINTLTASSANAAEVVITSQSIRAPAAAPTSTSIPTVKAKGAMAVAWDCPKCNNNNRSDRMECFRCRTDKPALATTTAATAVAPVKSSPKSVSNSDRVISTISTNNAINKGIAVRSKDWAPQATEKTISANNALRELAGRENRDMMAEWQNLVGAFLWVYKCECVSVF